MDMDINSEPGPGRADKSVDSNNQADNATTIRKSISESMKFTQDKITLDLSGMTFHSSQQNYPLNLK